MGDSPFLRRISKKKNDTTFGRKAEDRAAKRMGSKVHPGSGSVGTKGDYTVGDLKIENKSTINESFSVKLEWLTKISVEAKEVNKIPALAIQFVNNQGQSKKHGNWIALPEEIAVKLIEGLNEDT